LAPFFGKTARFNLLPFSLVCTIQEDGSLRAAEHDASADAICTISPSLLPRLALGDGTAFDQIERSGDAALVDELFYVARNLRWDAAEDLSPITGDIAAERIVKFAAGARRQVRSNALNLAQALAEYWTEERPLVAVPRQIAAFGQGVAELHGSIDALEQRLERLAKAG
jgi:ubiquinone biosynthesis protein UbiJ